eukprot:11655048-Alexandrium_andersonii.AAC.1
MRGWRRTVPCLARRPRLSSARSNAMATAAALQPSCSCACSACSAPTKSATTLVQQLRNRRKL